MSPEFTQSGRGLRTAMVVAILLVATVSSVPLVGADHNTNVPSSEVTQISKNVSFWQGAVFSTRADETAAETQIPNAQFFLESGTSGPVNLNYGTIPVFTEGSQITLEMRERTGATDIENVSVDLVAARLTANRSAFQAAFNSLPNQSFNDTAHFEVVDTGMTDSQGAVDLTHTPTTSGEYVYFVTTNESNHAGAVTQNGNISFDGNVTIVGLDQVTVQDRASSVQAPSSVVRGNNASFDVQSNLGTGTTTHAVIVYDRQKYTNQKFTLDLNDSDKFNLSKATLEHTLASVNGVRRIENDTTLFGTTLSEGTRTGSFGVGEFVSLLSNRTGLGAPDNVTTGSAVLDASVTVVKGGPSETVDVTTLSDFDTGTYQYVHMSVNENSRPQLSTTTGTFQVQTPPTGPGTAPGGGGGGGAGPGLITTPGEGANITVVSASLNDTSIAPGNAVRVSATVSNRGDSSGSREVRLYVNGTYTGNSRIVRLGGGERETISFVRTFDEPGTYDIRVGERRAGRLAVTGEAAPPSDGVRVVGASLGKTTVEAGEYVDVTATIENPTAESRELTVNLTADGERVAQRIVQVPADTTTSVRFSQRFDDPGTYEIAVNGVSAGTLTVEEMAGPPGTPTETPPPTETPGPGDGLGLVVVGLGILILLGLLGGGAYYLYTQGAVAGAAGGNPPGE